MTGPSGNPNLVEEWSKLSDDERRLLQNELSALLDELGAIRNRRRTRRFPESDDLAWNTAFDAMARVIGVRQGYLVRAQELSDERKRQ